MGKIVKSDGSSKIMIPYNIKRGVRIADFKEYRVELNYHVRQHNLLIEVLPPQKKLLFHSSVTLPDRESTRDRFLEEYERKRDMLKNLRIQTIFSFSEPPLNPCEMSVDDTRNDTKIQLIESCNAANGKYCERLLPIHYTCDICKTSSLPCSEVRTVSTKQNEFIYPLPISDDKKRLCRSHSHTDLDRNLNGDEILRSPDSTGPPPFTHRTKKKKRLKGATAKQKKQLATDRMTPTYLNHEQTQNIASAPNLNSATMPANRPQNRLINNNRAKTSNIVRSAKTSKQPSTSRSYCQRCKETIPKKRQYELSPLRLSKPGSLTQRYSTGRSNYGNELIGSGNRDTNNRPTKRTSHSCSPRRHNGKDQSRVQWDYLSRFSRSFLT